MGDFCIECETVGVRARIHPSSPLACKSVLEIWNPIFESVGGESTATLLKKPSEPLSHR